MRTYGKYLRAAIHPDLWRRQHQSADRGRCAAASTSWSPRPAGCSITCSRRRSTWRIVEILVLDEADRMLDMGFIRDIRRILALLPAKRQNLLFSATFSNEIRTAGRRSAARPGADRRRAPQRRVRTGHAARAPGRSLAQARTALPSRVVGRLAPGAGVHAHEERRQPPGRATVQGRHRGHGDPRQQEPAGAHAGAGRLQGRHGARPGGHRHRGARPGHRGTAPRGQFRAAERARGLCPSHRPHRTRRQHAARRSRWCRRRRARCSPTSKNCSRAASTARSSPGFEPGRTPPPQAAADAAQPAARPSRNAGQRGKDGQGKDGRARAPVKAKAPARPASHAPAAGATPSGAGAEWRRGRRSARERVAAFRCRHCSAAPHGAAAERRGSRCYDPSPRT